MYEVFGTKRTLIVPYVEMDSLKMINFLKCLQSDHMLTSCFLKSVDVLKDFEQLEHLWFLLFDEFDGQS